MEKISNTLEEVSNRLIDRNLNTSTKLIDSGNVERLLKSYGSIIEPAWEARHAKLVYKIGCSAYAALAEKALKFGRNPRAYMATLVNQELASVR